MESNVAPRPYRMTTRAAAVAETRSRIVDAAKVLHAQRGVVLTSWELIAEAADVSTATAYRHFPSLADLIPACARSVFDVIEPPTVEEAADQFAALDRPEDRLEHLVRSSCACYAKGAGWLHAAHRERDFVAELDAALGVIEGTLEVLVEAAFGAPLGPEDRALLVVLCDFPLWWSLQAQGIDRAAVEEQLVRLVRANAARIAG